MTTNNSWFSSLFCTKCLCPKEEAQLEIFSDTVNLRNDHLKNVRSSPTREKSPTKVYGIKPLSFTHLNSALKESSEVKTAPSTKDHTVTTLENKPNQVEIALNTPRHDMQLEVIESDYLEVGKKFVIKANGLVNGVATINPKQVIFGTGPADDKKDQKDTGNDIICAKYKAGAPVQAARILFDTDGFRLEDFGGGDGVYVKVEDKTLLGNQIVYYGIGHCFVQVLQGLEDSPKPRLKLKFIDGRMEGQEKIFEPDQICTFGRLSTCTIIFDEYGVSRIQCKIFNENGKWYIKDGDGFKKSTNGTWILINEKTPIFNKMAFKVCNSVFKANLLEAKAS